MLLWSAVLSTSTTLTVYLHVFSDIYLNVAVHV